MVSNRRLVTCTDVLQYRLDIISRSIMDSSGNIGDGITILLAHVYTFGRSVTPRIAVPLVADVGVATWVTCNPEQGTIHVRQNMSTIGKENRLSTLIFRNLDPEIIASLCASYYF
jgi:hypothetical protein